VVGVVKGTGGGNVSAFDEVMAEEWEAVEPFLGVNGVVSDGGRHYAVFQRVGEDRERAGVANIRCAIAVLGKRALALILKEDAEMRALRVPIDPSEPEWNAIVAEAKKLRGIP
jgi:hypothetical protein